MNFVKILALLSFSISVGTTLDASKRLHPDGKEEQENTPRSGQAELKKTRVCDADEDAAMAALLGLRSAAPSSGVNHFAGEADNQVDPARPQWPFSEHGVFVDPREPDQDFEMLDPEMAEAMRLSLAEQSVDSGMAIDADAQDPDPDYNPHGEIRAQVSLSQRLPDRKHSMHCAYYALWNALHCVGEMEAYLTREIFESDDYLPIWETFVRKHDVQGRVNNVSINVLDDLLKYEQADEDNEGMFDNIILINAYNQIDVLEGGMALEDYIVQSIERLRNNRTPQAIIMNTAFDNADLATIRSGYHYICVGVHYEDEASQNIVLDVYDSMHPFGNTNLTTLRYYPALQALRTLYAETDFDLLCVKQIFSPWCDTVEALQKQHKDPAYIVGRLQAGVAELQAYARDKQKDFEVIRGLAIGFALDREIDQQLLIDCGLLVE